MSLLLPYTFKKKYRCFKNKKGNSRRRRKKIVVLRFEHIGDVVLITPFLHQLRQAFPDAEISVAIGIWAKEVLINNRDVSRVLIVNHPQSAQNKKYAACISITKFVIASLFYRYDVCIDPRSYLATSVIAWLIHAPVRLGFSGTKGRFFLNTFIRNEANLQEVNRTFLLLKYFNVFSEPSRPIVTLTDMETKEVEMLARKMRLRESVTIFLHDCAPWKPRELPRAAFIQLIRLLLERITVCKCVIVGTPGEETNRELRRVFSNEPRVIYQSDFTLSLRTLRGLYDFGRLYIGIDSGPMHLASCSAIPILAIMGPGEFPRFAPYNYQDDSKCIVMRKEIDCSLCKQDFGLNKCKKGEETCLGLQQISAKDILSNALRLLN